MNSVNLQNYPRPQYEINQFVQPQNSELAGEKFYFVMDDGYDYELAFSGKETVEWNYAGETPKSATYQCHKADDETYLLDFELDEFAGKHERVNHFFIIDLAQRLVTMAICKVGENPRFPYLVSSKYIFGAIKTDGCRLPLKRHCFTADLVGTRIEWHWNTTMITQHSYYTWGFYRITTPAMQLTGFDRTTIFGALPASDEIAQYIKIKDNMYLFSLVEEIMERAFHDKNPPFRSNDMKFLINFDRMYMVGRTFGNVKEGGREGSSTNTLNCHIRFAAFANPVTFPASFLEAENPYAP